MRHPGISDFSWFQSWFTDDSPIDEHGVKVMKKGTIENLGELVFQIEELLKHLDDRAPGLLSNDADKIKKQIEIVHAAAAGEQEKAALTREDWEEIYYALEYKQGHHPAASVDEEWAGHLENIMLKIGVDGCQMLE